MVKGYIMINLVPGLESGALTQIRSIPGVMEVNLVFGSWDAIAITEAKTLSALSTLVVNQIRGVQGVSDTATLVQGET
jgi:DNA-binding Lrp family transcriptional regulator